jgi:hypothetical protein
LQEGNQQGAKPEWAENTCYQDTNAAGSCRQSSKEGRITVITESTIEAAQTVAEATPFIPKKRYRCFHMPRRIAYDDNLKLLGHNSLKLYVFLVHRLYRRPAQETIILGEWEIAKCLAISADAIPAAREQLKELGLIDFRVRNKINAEYLITHDVSLHEAVTSLADLPK